LELRIIARIRIKRVIGNLDESSTDENAQQSSAIFNMFDNSEPSVNETPKEDEDDSAENG